MRKHLLLMVFMMVAMAANAFDHCSPSGDTLTYSIISGSNNEVRVMKTSGVQYSGHLIIPSTVEYNGITYTVTAIAQEGFLNCSQITSVTLPSTLTQIGYRAFKNCTSLSQLDMGNNVETIQGQAFYQCNLSSVTIPQTMNNIGSEAFHNNPNLNTLVYNADSCGFYPFYYTFDTNLTSVTIGSTVRYLPQGFIRDNRNVSEIVLPDSVRFIDNSAFSGCSGLSTLTVGQGLVYVSNWGFNNCNITVLYYNADSLSNYSSFFGNNITTLFLGPNIRHIPNNLFSNCTSLSGILVLPDGVTYVGTRAFYNCDGITSVHIPPSVQSIGENAFASCDSLSVIYFNAVNCTIPNSIYAPFAIPIPFSVTFGGAVLKIPDYIFRSNNNLISVTIGVHTTVIGQEAFSSCHRLQSLDISAPVSVIGHNAFSNCDSVTTLTLPATLDSIATEAFSGMTRLQRVNFLGTAEEWCGITFKSNPVYYSRCLYIGTSRLEHLQLAGGASKVSAKAFQRCSSLRSINTGHVCSVIEADAFKNCDSLETVVFGTGLDSIGQDAFYYCNRIDSAVCRSTVPPALNIQAFQNYGNNVTLHVPCGTAETYTASAWHNRFNNITEGFFNGVSAVSANEEQGSAEVTQFPSCTSPYAVIVATPSDGYLFDHWQDGNNSNPRTVNIISDTLFTAYFEVDSTPVPDTVYYTVTVTVNNPVMGSATVNGSASVTVMEGETVSLVATANQGYHFVSWSDNVTTNPRTLTLTQDTIISAIFAINQYSVQVTAGEGGTVTGGGTYQYLDIATLTASPNSGHHFTQWQDGNNSNPRTVTITSDTLFTAYFEVDSTPVPDTGYYTVTVTVNNPVMGSATVNGIASVSVTDGETVSLVATANQGYHFVSWSDNVTYNPRTLTVTQDTLIVATFATNSYYIDVTASEGGTVTGGGTYQYLDTATLTATPYIGYHFSHWQDGYWTNPRTVTVTGDHSYTAYFEESCATISTFPWNSNFTTELACWTTVDADGDGYTWTLESTNIATSESVYLDGNFPHALTPDDWLISPKIHLPSSGTYSLSWFIPYDFYEEYLYNQNYSVYVSTSGTSIEDFTTLLFTEVLPSTNLHRSVSLQAYHGQTFRFAFRHHDSQSVLPLELADIRIALSTQGIDNVSDNGVSIHCEDGQIIVNMDGQPAEEFLVYDLMGRQVFHGIHTGKTSTLSGGVYLVKVGSHPVQRVVVVR